MERGRKEGEEGKQILCQFFLELNVINRAGVLEHPLLPVHREISGSQRCGRETAVQHLSPVSKAVTMVASVPAKPSMRAQPSITTPEQASQISPHSYTQITASSVHTLSILSPCCLPLSTQTQRANSNSLLPRSISGLPFTL